MPCARECRRSGTVKTLHTSIIVQGSTASPSTIRASLDIPVPGRRDPEFNKSPDTEVIRVRVCNHGLFANSTNATIAAANGCTVVETHTAGKDLSIKGAAGFPGEVRVTLTNATAEAVTVRCGAPLVGGAAEANYQKELDVTHA